MAGQRQRASEGGHEGRILRAIRRIMHSVDLYSRKLALDRGVTGPQLSCLLTIAKSGPLTLTELAGRVDLTPATVVGIMDRLEKKGLVRRIRSQTDRRQVQISTTEQGKLLAEGAPSPLQDRLVEALATLPVRDRASIALSLERVADLMKPGHGDAAPIVDTAIPRRPVTFSLPTASTKKAPPASAPSAPAVSDA